MAGRTCTFLVGGRAVTLDGLTFGLAREIYGRRSYFLNRSEIRRGDLVIDLGANAGVFSILAARFGARVIAVEAQASECRRLAATLELNPDCAHAITPVHGIVGPGSGVLSRWSLDDFGGLSPPIVTVGGLLERFGGPKRRIDFLKIDVEGSEFDLISADADWLTCTTRIAMEVHTAFGDAGLLVEVLEDRGFYVRLRDATGRDIRQIKGEGGYLYALARTSGLGAAALG
jgi:FkbM family methyltransferase